MIFGGDFQQILPVIPHGSRGDIVNTSLRKSYLWNNMEILKLRHNMCLEQSEDDYHFSQWLLDVGHGRNCDENGYIEIPAHMVTYDKDHLIHHTYGDMHEVPEQFLPKYFLDCEILAPRNTDVQQTNAKILAHLRGEEIVYNSADAIESESHHDNVPQDFLHSLEPPSLHQ